jgi:predicted nucleotidyltransferase
MYKVPNRITKSIKDYINYLENTNIHIKEAILFGSYAKGNSNEFSDIDLALVSENFTGSRFFDLDTLRDAKFAVNTDISPLPYRPEDFTEDNLFVKEILNYGIRII